MNPAMPGVCQGQAPTASTKPGKRPGNSRVCSPVASVSILLLLSTCFCHRAAVRPIRWMALLTIMLLAMAGRSGTAATPFPWWKGNLPTHFLLSDGRDYPELNGDLYQH